MRKVPQYIDAESTVKLNGTRDTVFRRSGDSPGGNRSYRPEQGMPLLIVERGK